MYVYKSTKGVCRGVNKGNVRHGKHLTPELGMLTASSPSSIYSTLFSCHFLRGRFCFYTGPGEVKSETIWIIML